MTNGKVAAHERILIAGGRVYDHDGDIHNPPVMDIAIEGGRITDVRPATDPASRAGFDRVIDASRKLVLPGFFNAHYHSHDTLLKGSFETISLDLWGSYAMPPAYPRRSKEELRLRTLVGAVECLRSGITTVQDMTTLTPFDEDDLDVVLNAYDEVGIRCIFAPQFANVPRAKTRVFYDELIPAGEMWRLSSGIRQFPEGSDIVARLGQAIKDRRGHHPLVDFAIGPSSPETCTRDVWEKIGRLSSDENIPIYTHVYENKGMTHIARESFRDHRGSLIHWLSDLGVLGPRCTFAHSVWLRDDEMDLLAKAGANVVINPVGNLKTRSGVAPARALLERGINVGLGCDNCSCGDAQNMYQAMKLFTLLAAICDAEEGPPLAGDALRAATLAGAATAGRTDLGAIKPGMSADLSIIDLSDISFVPLNSVARQLVYTEAGRAVHTVLVDGRVVVEDRRVKTIDEAKLADDVAAVMPALRADLDSVRNRLAPILPCLCEAQRRTWKSDIGVNRFIAQECP
jgi:guanine deaminase